MLRKVIYSLAFIAVIASASLAQSRTMLVGDVELRLGMSEDAAMKLLSNYKLTLSGNTFFVAKYNEKTKLYDLLGGVAFEKEQLTYISRDLDTSAWPAYEGFSVGRAIYDGLNGSITRTDSDGAKRANALIVIGNHDASSPSLMNFRTIDIYVEERKITVIITDAPDGKRVSAQVAIRSKPW